MGYAIGAAKYWMMGLLFNPFNLYIYGGGLLWFLDVVDLAGAETVEEFTINYILMEYGIPSSLEDFLFQLFVGTTVATILWLIGSLRYAASRGWR